MMLKSIYCLDSSRVPATENEEKVVEYIHSAVGC